jgi:hypothetical protein
MAPPAELLRLPPPAELLRLPPPAELLRLPPPAELLRLPPLGRIAASALGRIAADGAPGQTAARH